MKKIVLLLLIIAGSGLCAQAPLVTSDGVELPVFSAEQQELFIISKILFDAQIRFFSEHDYLAAMETVIKGLDTHPEVALSKLLASVTSFVEKHLDEILQAVASEFGQDPVEFTEQYKPIIEQSLGMKIQEFVIVYSKSGLHKRSAKTRSPIRIKD